MAALSIDHAEARRIYSISSREPKAATDLYTSSSQFALEHAAFSAWSALCAQMRLFFDLQFGVGESLVHWSVALILLTVLMLFRLRTLLARTNAAESASSEVQLDNGTYFFYYGSQG